VLDGRNSQYSGWEIEGRLTVTQGDVLDFEQIENDLIEDSKRFQVEEIAYDPWQATQLAQRLQTQGANVIEFRNTVANFSAPMKELDALVRSGRFHYNGDPVLTWMVSNVVCHVDAKENIYPRKERAENKIDGVVALIMALGRSMVAGQPAPDYQLLFVG
jgi:phage terminase large subunit-like protein